MKKRTSIMATKRRNSKQSSVKRVICLFLIGGILSVSTGCSENSTSQAGAGTNISAKEDTDIDIGDVINETTNPQTYLETQGYKESNTSNYYTLGTTAAGIQETSTKAVQAVSEYIFPDSNIRLLTEEEMNSLSQDELRIAVNEIYARHGRKFADAKLQEYFNTKSWYQGTIEPDQFNEMVFNEFEKENVKKLSDRKNEKPSGTLAVEQIYGIYECHTEYLDAELEVGVYTSDDTDYIRLVGSSPDGGGFGEFEGIVVSSKENNYTAVDEFGNVIDVYFDGSGNANVTDGNTGLGGMYFPGFGGIYQMTADFSQAG